MATIGQVALAAAAADWRRRRFDFFRAAVVALRRPEGDLEAMLLLVDDGVASKSAVGVVNRHNTGFAPACPRQCTSSPPRAAAPAAPAWRRVQRVSAAARAASATGRSAARQA